MLGKPILNLHRALLLAALTIALVATGFAHRLPSAGYQTLVFALENGIPLADLCADGEAGDQHRAPGCVACQIAEAADLPPAPGGQLRQELALQASVTAPRESRIVPRVLDPSNAPQGPPTA